MREKYESLSLAVLKELAKARGMKGISTMKKSSIIEAMLAQDMKDQESGAASETVAEEKEKSREDIIQIAEMKQETEQPAHYVKRDYRSQERQSFSQGEGRRERAESSGEMRRERAESSGEMRRERADNNGEMRRDRTENNGEMRGDRPPADLSQLDSGIVASGILEVMPDGYGFIRSDNYLPGENDVYVSPSQIRKFNLKTGDIISGNTRIKAQQEKFGALLYLKTINGKNPAEAMRRYNFEDMTPVFPNERMRMERGSSAVAMRIVDLLVP